jgi:hypothetical protein
MSAVTSDAARATDRAAWDRLVADSPQGSVFCRPAFLDALGVTWEPWFVGGRPPLAAALVVRDGGGRALRAPLPYTLYQGVLLAASVAAAPTHRRVRQTIELVGELLGRMSEIGSLSFCLHPSFPDLRPFSWFHYHEPERGRFALDLRYTGRIDLSAERGLEGFLAGCRAVRRQEYRKAAAGFAVAPSAEIDLLDELHARTFGRQGLGPPARDAAALRRIAAAALAGEFGELLVARDQGGRPASAALFLFDAHTSYYLIAANDPAYRSSGTSTLLLVEGVRRALARGSRTVDVVGMNSPTRGDFKASFGATPVPYLVASWDGEEACASPR